MKPFSECNQPGIYVNDNPLTVYKKIICTPKMFCGWILDTIVGIAELIIPPDALIVFPESRNVITSSHKMRTNKAYVKSITGLSGGDLSYYECSSAYDPNFIYRIGSTVEADVNINYHSPCESGIHFYLDKKSAIQHILQ